jgi:hypothetical protein
MDTRKIKRKIIYVCLMLFENKEDKIIKNKKVKIKGAKNSFDFNLKLMLNNLKI